MAGSLTGRWSRRALTVAAVGVTFYGVLRYQDAWAGRWAIPAGEVTGWLLLALVGALTFLNVRKRFTRIPLLPATLWVDVHVFLGLLAGLFLLIHVGYSWPRAALNWGYLLLFASVWASGLGGLGLSRWVPRRLRERGEEVIYERIPAHRARLCQRVLEIVDQDLAQDEMPTIAAFAVETLLPFMERPQNRFAHLFRARRHLQDRLGELDEMERYVSARERHIKTELAALLTTKDDLDYSEAHQALLKYWLFVHIPLTYALLLIAPAHIAWALLF